MSAGPPSDDEKFMRHALHLAERGQGHTSPNPCVGALIVSHTGQVLSEGWHQKAGEAHAEIHALRNLPSPSDAQGSTLYVTLEPCSTHGRTAACTDAILQSGITRVVIGATDPNPVHAGRGHRILEENGITVTSGILADECTDLNRAFNHWITTGLPWVVLKAGMSLDGKITRSRAADGWLTGPESRKHAHQMRDRTDAILIGAGTAITDNPRLTIREAPATRQPWRIVLTGNRPIPPDSHLLTDPHRDRTLIFQNRSLPDVLADLGKRQITHLILEGGATIHQSALSQRLVHEVHLYLAPLLLGAAELPLTGLTALPREIQLIHTTTTPLGRDTLITARIARGHHPLGGSNEKNTRE